VQPLLVGGEGERRSSGTKSVKIVVPVCFCFYILRVATTEAEWRERAFLPKAERGLRSAWVDWRRCEVSWRLLARGLVFLLAVTGIAGRQPLLLVVGLLVACIVAGVLVFVLAVIASVAFVFTRETLGRLVSPLGVFVFALVT
jgi:hypothetical protein